MPLILSLETSTSVCSVAVHDTGKLRATGAVHIAQSHASKLAVLIENTVRLADIKIDQLNAVAIASGPGSYTGLRIGTSTAKGLCYALNIPLVAVNTLDLLAYQVSECNIENAFLCPMIDARRMEVYCQVVDAQLNVVQPIEAKIIDETSFADLLNERKILFFGDGAEKCRDVLKHQQAFFLKDISPSAVQLGQMVYQKFQQNQVENLMYFEPFYLKDFVAKKPLMNA